MLIFNLIEYSGIYLKISGRSWQYYRDEPTLASCNNIINFPANNKNIPFKFKEKITGQTGNDSIKDINIMIPLIYLSNFGGTLEPPLISCEIELILTWSDSYFLSLVLWQIKYQNLQ